MKKIFSMFIVLVVLIMSLSGLTVFAAAGDTGVSLTGEGVTVELKEDGAGLITATVSVTGALNNVASACAGLLVDFSKVSIQKQLPSKVLYDTTQSSLSSIDFVTLDNGLPAPDKWFSDTAVINVGSTTTTKYVSMGIGTSDNGAYFSLNPGVKKELFKFYFVKKSGATIDNTTFKLKVSGSGLSTYTVDKGVTMIDSKTTSGNLAKFAVLVTPAAAGYAVTYDPANGGAITTPTQSKFEFPADPVKQGYDFVGWFNGATQYTNGNDVTGPIPLTASYKLTKGTVSADPKSGDIKIKTSLNPGDTGTVTAATKILTIGGKVPADAVAGDDFGIMINGKKFQSLSNPANCPGGLFIIKLVDIQGNVLTGNYSAFNYYKTSTSDTPVVVSGE